MAGSGVRRAIIADTEAVTASLISATHKDG
jgi:hypothetical protein